MTILASNPSSECADDDPSESFVQVCATLQLQNLPALALQLRHKDVAASDTTCAVHDCRVLPDPLYGSQHILFKIEFNDGVRWLLRIPSNGYPGAFDATSARTLRCEALTMHLIKRETTVPVPKVYHFDDTLDNELGCPFMLMEYIDGRPLYEVWFDQTIDPELIEQRRCRALDGVARAIVQLNKFVFTRGGEIIFDHNGNPCDIGPMRMTEIDAMLKSMDEDDDSDGPYFCTVGPFSSAKSWFMCMLDKREPPPDKYSLGVYKALRLFIDLLFPESDSSHEGKEEEEEEFVLSHPDFDIQNVIVAEDGSLLALIDWDGASTVPRCLGNEAYPSWLTRDWDGAKYSFVEDAPPGPDSPNNNENSPSELKHYREVYEKIIEKISDSPSTAKKVTLNSLLLENLYIAASDPICTHSIVGKIFREIRKITTSSEPNGDGVSNGGTNNRDGKEDREDNADGKIFDEDIGRDNGENDSFFEYEVLTAFQSGKLDERDLERLTRGFQVLLM